jgi:hypothetical protein
MGGAAMTLKAKGWKGDARRAAALAGEYVADAGLSAAAPTSRSGAASEVRRATGANASGQGQKPPSFVSRAVPCTKKRCE